MKVLILFANNSVRNEKADPDALRAILERAHPELGSDMQFFVSYARSLSYYISNEEVVIRDHRNKRNLDSYDFVYFRKAGAAMQQMLVCAAYLKDHNIPFFDAEIRRANSRNKLSQMYLLQRRGLPIPKTLFCRNKRRVVRLVTKKYASEFPFPIIAKATGGTRGDENYLVKDADQLRELVRTSHRHFLIQEFIENDGDYRFFVANGILRGVIERKGSEGTHLNNTSKGAAAELVSVESIDMLVRSQSVQAARIFGRDIAGVDVMFDKHSGEHVFLEVNRAPQIEGASFQTEKGQWLVDAIEQAVIDFQPMQDQQNLGSKSVIGRFERVHIFPDGVSRSLVAKIDTGADSSSLHVDMVREVAGNLLCKIEGVDYHFSKYFTKAIRSSNGALHVRYIVDIPIDIGGRKYTMKSTLSDRSTMCYPMLIGRRFLRSNNFVVDVSRRFVQTGARKKR